MKRFEAILFFSLSLGIITTIPLMGKGYELTFAEIFLFGGLLFMTLRLLRGSAITTYSGDFIPLLWLLTIVWAIAGHIWAVDPMRQTVGALALVEGILTYLLLIEQEIDSNVFRLGMRIFSLCLVIQLAFNLFSFLLSGANISFYAIKVHAVTAMGGSNFVAIFLSFAFIYEFACRSRGYLLFTSINGLGLVLTLSRGGIISVLVALCFLVTLEIKKRKFGIVAQILILCAGILLIAIATQVGSILIDSLVTLPEASSVGTRIGLINKAYAEFLESPFLGHGLQWEGDPHNLIMKVLKDLGLLGALPFMALLFFPLVKYFSSFWNRQQKRNVEVSALLLGYVTVIIHSLFETMFFSPASQIWLGIILAQITRQAHRKSTAIHGSLGNKIET